MIWVSVYRSRSLLVFFLFRSHLMCQLLVLRSFNMSEINGNEIVSEMSLFLNHSLCIVRARNNCEIYPSMTLTLYYWKNTVHPQFSKRQWFFSAFHKTLNFNCIYKNASWKRCQEKISDKRDICSDWGVYQCHCSWCDLVQNLALLIL